MRKASCNGREFESKLAELESEVKRIKSEAAASGYRYAFENKLSRRAKKVLYDIEENYNCSWAVFMYSRNAGCKSMGKTAVKYRGNEISYAKLYSKAFEYARAMKAMGVAKGDEVPVCVSNIPEYLYLRFACSFIGAVIHMVGTWFDPEYLEDILNNTGSSILFISDDKYMQIKPIIERSQIRKSVVISLTDSLKTDEAGNSINPYEDLESPFHVLENKLDEIKAVSVKEILTQHEFLDMGRNYIGKVLEKVSLDDLSAITYTSGTTKPGCPKGVKQSNRSYITFARFKSSDVSGLPEMKNMTALSIIPTYAHTQLSAMSDVLFCNCTFCCEPFGDKEFFPYAILINKPNYCPCPVGFWIHLGKTFAGSEYFKKIKMPYLMLPEVVGEELSPGEERFLNRISREHGFGTGRLPFPLAPVTFSIGGGTTEGGGLFTTLYRSLQEKKPMYIINKAYSLGLYPLKLAEVEVLNAEGDYCGLNEPGLLVVNSPGNMMGYTGNNQEGVYVSDTHGKKWLNMGTIAYKSDPKGSIKMKGRSDDYTNLKDGSFFPYFRIEEAVAKDKRNILSCTVVKNPEGNIVVHVEPQPDARLSSKEIIYNAAKRLSPCVPEEILGRIYFRFRSNEESFAMSSSGKRNYSALKYEREHGKLVSVNELLSADASYSAR